MLVLSLFALRLHRVYQGKKGNSNYEAETSCRDAAGVMFFCFSFYPSLSARNSCQLCSELRPPMLYCPHRLTGPSLVVEILLDLLIIPAHFGKLISQS